MATKRWIPFPILDHGALDGLDNLSIQAIGILAVALLQLNGRSSGVVRIEKRRGTSLERYVNELRMAGEWQQLSSSSYRVTLSKSLILQLSVSHNDNDSSNDREKDPHTTARHKQGPTPVQPAEPAPVPAAEVGGVPPQKPKPPAADHVPRPAPDAPIQDARIEKRLSDAEYQELLRFMDDWDANLFPEKPMSDIQRKTVKSRILSHGGLDSGAIIRAGSFLALNKWVKYRGMPDWADEGLLNGAHDLDARFKVKPPKPVAGGNYQDLGYPSTLTLSEVI